jgi:hypothetical protein
MEQMARVDDEPDMPGYEDGVAEALAELRQKFEAGQKVLETTDLHWSPLWITWMHAEAIYDQIKDQIGDSEVIPAPDMLPGETTYKCRAFNRWWWLAPKQLASPQDVTVPTTPQKQRKRGKPAAALERKCKRKQTEV